MKINRVIFLLLFIWVALILVVAQSLIILSGGNSQAIPGAKEVPYSVYLNNSEPVAGFQIKINYTKEIIYQRIDFSSRILNPIVAINKETPGTLKIAVLSQEEIPPGSEELFKIIFDVNESSTPLNSTLNLSEFIAANINSNILTTESSNGNFEIVEPYDIEFLPPIINFENFTLIDGSTLPLKFNVTKNGVFILDNSVTTRIHNLTLGIDKIYNASGTGDEYIRINSEEGNYIVNIRTSDLGMLLGEYSIEVRFGNFQEEEIGFELIEPGPENGKGKGKPRE